MNRILHSSRIGVELGYVLAACTINTNEAADLLYQNILLPANLNHLGRLHLGVGAEISTHLQSSKSTQERVSFRDCTYIKNNMVQIFGNSDEFHSEKDEADKGLPSNQDSMSLLLQLITNYYIFQPPPYQKHVQLIHAFSLQAFLAWLLNIPKL